MSAKRKEVPLPSGRRLDEVPRKDTAVEIERSGNPQRIKLAIERLRESRKRRKVLRVPDPDRKKAAKIMRQEALSGSVTNLSKAKRIQIKKRRKSR